MKSSEALLEPALSSLENEAPPFGKGDLHSTADRRTTMGYPFTKDRAQRILKEKRRILGRGLCYAEKILFIHEAAESAQRILKRGQDPLKLYPDRVAMQDATAQMAMLQLMQTGCSRTRVPATIHCDHLIRARDGMKADLKEALVGNREIYDFLSSAAVKFGVGFWGPGSGIIHQVVLENYAVPGGLMLGSDSHTPNAGGLGMLAIGVGGADVAEVMAGLAWETPMPFVVGVALSGRLDGWSSAKDVILEMLSRLTVKGGTGKIFEYFGRGAGTLSAAQKATICNMGAELGATASVFVYDESMDAYLKNVGRQEDAEWAASVADILNQDAICLTEPERVYDEILQIDLGKIVPGHAGPYSPDKVTPIAEFKNAAKHLQCPPRISAVLVGSCTNSSYADLCAVSQVLEQGRQHGLKARVPFILSPGSRQVYETIGRDGVLDELVRAGAVVLAASCGPCIGQWERKDIETGALNCLFTTFNRNFRGRNDGNPETRAFLTSPAVAAALALSGDAGFNPETDTLTGSDGVEFKLTAPTPPPLPEKGLVREQSAFLAPSGGDAAIEVSIDPHSERVERLQPFEAWNGRDFVELPVLVKTKGKTTTDHISPGGKWLRYRGHLTRISQNMLAGAVNAFTGETGRGTNVLTRETGVRFAELARFYRETAGGFVIIGDENYGEGSSREHAAMSPRFMGAKVVVARSFARIHEANLKKQGILPLTFMRPDDYTEIGEFDRMSFVNLNALQPGKPLKCLVRKADGSRKTLMLAHTLTDEQIGWFRAGSALNTLREAFHH